MTASREVCGHFTHLLDDLKLPAEWKSQELPLLTQAVAVEGGV